MTCNTPTVYVPLGTNAVVTFDMTPRLESAELLTGSPSVSDADLTGELSLVNFQVNSVADLGNEITVGKAVQFQISSSATTETSYNLDITAVTDGSPSQTLTDSLVVVFC